MNKLSVKFVMVYTISVAITVFLLSSCDRFQNDRHVYLEFKGDESFNIENTEFTVSIYGYDMNVADAPATIIAQKTENASRVPIRMSMRVPGNAADMIKYINKKEDALYYICINWDSNGDGKIGKGDIGLNHSKGMDVFLKSFNRQTFYLETIPDYAPIE